MKSSDQGYRCDGHVNRMRNEIDPFVLGAVRERISRLDSREWCATLRQPTNPKRIAEIDEELRHARGLINSFEDDYADGDIPAALYKKSVERQEARIAALEAERTELTPQSSTAALLDKDDPVGAFDAIKDLGQLSYVIDSLCTITLLQWTALLHKRERTRRKHTLRLENRRVEYLAPSSTRVSSR